MTFLKIISKIKRALERIGKGPEVKATARYDTTVYTQQQLEEIAAMWQNWKRDKSLYRNQSHFAEAVNTALGTRKVKATIIRIAKQFKGM